MIQSRVILVALVGLCVLATASHTLGQQNDPKPNNNGNDELKFNGNNQGAADGIDTSLDNNKDNRLDNNNVINNEDNNNNNNQGQGPDNGQQQQQPSQWPRPRPPHSRPFPRPSPFELLPPPGFFGGFGGPDPFSPFGDIFGGDSSLDPLSPRRRPQSLIHSLLSGGLFDNMNRFHRQFESDFKNMERQAGEGQEVSYFNRNGVAYVKTCTTRRVTPDEQKQQVVPENKLIDQQQEAQPQQQQPQQQQLQQQPQPQPQQQQQPQLSQ